MPSRERDGQEYAVLDAGDLRRAVLARQFLAERAPMDIAGALESVAGLQSQYAPTMYIGCWSRLAGFRRDDLTEELAQRRVVQATMMRSTIHLVSAADYWPLTLAIRRARRDWWRRAHPGKATQREMEAAADRVRRAFDSATRLTRKELDAIAGHGLADGVGLFVDLVRVPPSGTWERRRADLYADALRWVGPQPALSDDDAIDHLVRRYLTGFEPATVNEIALWAGIKLSEVSPSVQRSTLRRFRAADGKLLVDLPDLPLPPPGGPLPVRFIGTWEALLLVHTRRAEIIREEDRQRIFGIRTPHSFNTFLVDGIVEGTWRHDIDHIELTPWRPVSKPTLRALHDEADRLATFYESSPPSRRARRDLGANGLTPASGRAESRFRD